MPVRNRTRKDGIPTGGDKTTRGIFHKTDSGGGPHSDVLRYAKTSRENVVKPVRRPTKTLSR